MRYIYLLLALIYFSSLHAQETFTAYLTGNQEVLPVTTDAYGEMTAVLEGDTLRVEGWFDNLSSNYAAEVAGGSHIHMGIAGLNGNVQFTLNPQLDMDSLGGRYEMEDNTFVLDLLQQEMLRNQRLYFNIHSRAHPSGELRGQILPAGAAHYFANLFGTGEVPSELNAASGAAWLSRYGDTVIVSGSFSNLESPIAADIAGGAHLHFGYAGQNGPVVIALNSSSGTGGMSGLFTVDNNTFVTSELNDALPERRVYVNIHSQRHRGGALRGQLTPPALRVFRAHLSGTQEIPVATTRASGVLLAELHPDTSLVVSGSFSGLESTVATDIAGGAHLHNGLAGSNGPVRFPLNLDLDAGDTSGVIAADSNRFELEIDDRRNLTNRNFYANIHTENYRAGEIRGQLLPYSQMTFVAPLSGIFEIPRANTFANGNVVIELTGNQMNLSGSFSGLSSSVDTTIAGGAHLHTGYTGENGPVAFPLSLDPDDPGTSGTLLASENSFTLDSDQMRALRARGMYVNIHTGNYPGGELRGPAVPEASMLFEASLGGGNQVPPFASRGYGGVLLELRDGHAVLSGSFSGMDGELDTTIAGGAHIHSGLAGQNGPIRLGLHAEANVNAGIFPASDNRFELNPAWVDSLRRWGFYVNIHTDASPSGELRGQLLPLAEAHYTATLMGINEVQPLQTSGMGAVKLVVNDNSLQLGGSFSGLESDFDEDIQMGSHIHLGFTGENGSIVQALNPRLSGDLRGGVYMPSENTFAFNKPGEEALFANRWYVNIHSVIDQEGEVRGQVLQEINMAPMPGEITQPADGATILIEGSADEEFTVEWSEANDANPVSTIWELALDPGFETTLIRFNASNASGVTLTYGLVDTLLSELGVAIGQTAVIYHRVRATDGSLNAVSEGKSVLITRGEVVATNDPVPEGYAFEVRPNLLKEGNHLTVELKSTGLEDGQLILVGMNGSPVLKRNVETDSYLKTHRLDIGGVSSGLYFLIWKTEDGFIGRRTISIVR